MEQEKFDWSVDKRFCKADFTVDFTVDMSRLSQAFQEAHRKLQDFADIDWQVYYAEQQRIANDLRWQSDPLEIKQHLEIIWNDILRNASDLFHMLGDVCDGLISEGDRHEY